MASKKSDRLRVVGWCVLGSGLIGAVVFYWLAVRSAEPAMDDLLGYTRSMQHEMGTLMGPSGLILTDFQQWLASPAGKATMIAVASLLLSACFFRAAWVLDENERLTKAHEC
jgi:hypothetical protein